MINYQIIELSLKGKITKGKTILKIKVILTLISLV